MLHGSHKVPRFSPSPPTYAVPGGAVPGGLQSPSVLVSPAAPVSSYSVPPAVSPSPAPLSSPTAAFVAGAAAVASVLSKPLLDNSESGSASDAKPFEEGGGGSSSANGAEVALDVARAAAAAAAAVSARQAVSNSAAMALQMAMKTAELIQVGILGFQGDQTGPLLFSPRSSPCHSSTWARETECRVSLSDEHCGAPALSACGDDRYIPTYSYIHTFPYIYIHIPTDTYIYTSAYRHVFSIHPYHLFSTKCLLSWGVVRIHNKDPGSVAPS